MKVELYPWQKKAINAWFNTTNHSYGKKGIIKAVTGAGKSMVGKEIVSRLMPLLEDERIVVTCYSNTILDQWRIILEEYDNIDFITHQMLYKMSRVDYPYKIRLLIVDEVHRSTSEKFSRLYQMHFADNILALSATPDELSEEYCGDILVDVGFDEANVSPFFVEFHGINLTGYENVEYSRYSYSIGNLYRHAEGKRISEDKIMPLIMARRQIVYNAKNRMQKTIDLISREYCAGKKILVITRRIEQANELHNRIKDIMSSMVYHSNAKKDLEEYRAGRIKILITVDMAKEGFDDVDTDCGIIMATPLTESFHIQSIGRIIRYKPGKLATIHIILANNTTDLEVLKYTDNYDFNLNDVVVPRKEDLALKELYYSGEKFSFCENRLWKKGTAGKRIQYKPHPVLKELAKVKHEGGAFVVANGKVMIKESPTKFTIVAEIEDEFELMDEDDTKKKVSWDEITKDWRQ